MYEKKPVLKNTHANFAFERGWKINELWLKVIMPTSQHKEA